jgi:hypothetical protein
MNIDLNNISNLDTDIVNTWSNKPFIEEEYSYIDPITAGLVAQAAPSIAEVAKLPLQTIGQIAIERANKICKKPIFPENPLNRGNWETYRSCMASEERKAKAEILARQKEAEAQVEALKLQGKLADIEAGKSAMPKGLIIGLSIGAGVLLIGTIILIATRKK